MNSFFLGTPERAILTLRRRQAIMARSSFLFSLRILIVCLLPVLPGALAVAAPAPAPELIAHGTGDHLWVGQVMRDSTRTPPGFLTRLMGRSIGKAWGTLGVVDGRVRALTNRGTDLAVLFESGEWVLYWPSNGMLTSALGQPLPMPGRILTFAADSRTLWAVARLKPAAAASAPATVPAATTHPATAPSGQLVLLSLSFNRWEWVEHGPPPESLHSADEEAISLAVVDHHPVLAVKGGQGIAVAEYSPPGSTQPTTRAGGGWSALRPIQPDFAVEQFKVLGDPERPGSILLWAAPKAGAGVVFKQKGDLWEAPFSLQGEQAAKMTGPRTIALAAERLRLISLRGEPPALQVQQFGLDGKPVGEPTKLGPRVDRYGQIEFYLEAILMAALIIAVIGTFYRRRLPPTPLPPDRLPLAPLSSRFAAGLIDGLPVVASIIIAAAQLEGQTSFSAANLDPIVKWILLGGFFVYLGYTTLIELIAGRTIGKMLLGLRIVTAEGRRPDWSALLMRNVLRMIDIWLAWLPLALIFYTPLRQRIGDVAAATVVVTNAPIPEAPAPEAAEEEKTDKNEPAAG